MTRVFTSIFSYNGPSLLSNAIDSLRAFFPACDFGVFDDASDDPRLDEYLNSLPKDQLKVVHRGTASQVRPRHGGFYHLMDKALDYAIEKEYDLILNMEDDMQWLWSDPSLVDKVMAVFQADEEPSPS